MSPHILLLTQMTLKSPQTALSFICTAIFLLTATPSFSDIAETPQFPFHDGIFTYSETTGPKQSTYTWERLPAPNNELLIKVINGDRHYRNTCCLNGATTSWQLKETDKHDFSAERDGNTIHLKGLLFGREEDKSFRIDERPWYQPLSFSLGKFLESGENHISFWILRVDTIEAITLTAKKMGEETITITGKEVPAEVVEIRAEGYKAKFWHATYWFRKSDKLFLQYKSVQGKPGTPETVIDLIDEKTGDLQARQKDDHTTLSERNS